jgi:uncharacterized membrane protein YfcA
VHAADIALLAIAGFAGGAVNAIAGGGSLLVFPALVTTGLSTVTANVTNSVALWPGYVGNLAGIGNTAKESTIKHKDLALICAVGAAIGVLILLHTPADAFDVVVPFLVIAAALLVAVQPVLTHRITGRAKHPIVLRVAVAFASIYGGYFGGALGVILLGTIGLTANIELRELNVLKSVLTMIVSTVSSICFIAFASIDWTAVAVIAPAALVGGAVGGRIAMHINERLLRVVVVLFGLTIGIWLGVRA